MSDTGRAPTEQHRQARASQSFWSMVVGIPAIFSVLRLSVEAGGELQTTLLLVANVDPINLLAALFTTATRFVSAGLVAIFAVGGVVLVSQPEAPTDPAGSAQPPRRLALFARWTEAVPVWFIVASLLLALVTWQVLYLPLLLPCAVAAFQAAPSLPDLTRMRVVMLLVLLMGYAWLVGPTVSAAVVQGEWLVVALFTMPPLLAVAIPGPLPRRLASPLAVVAQTTVVAMLILTAVPVITTPVLPLTVTTVNAVPLGDASSGPSDNANPKATASPSPKASADPGEVDTGEVDTETSASPGEVGATDEPSETPTDAPENRSEDILGHVISVDDVSMVILQENGGVRYVPANRVESQVLCPSEGELPRYRLWVHGFHIEDSLLEGLGRQVRPVSRLDAACRNPASR